jgi:hypothetical protein
MPNAILITKFIDSCVLEFTTIVNSHFLDCCFKLTLHSLDECLECIKRITLVNKKGLSSVSSEVIHNHKSILVASNAFISCWPK